MPIDPNLALSIRPLQFDNPLDSAGKALAMKQLILQNQSGEASFEDAQRLRSIYPQAGGDPEKLRDLLFKGGFPDKAIALDKDILANKKSKGDIAKTQEDVSREKMDKEARMAASFLAIPDDQKPAMYPQFVQQWNALGLTGPKGPGTIESEQWNPEFAKGLQMFASRGLTPEQAATRGDYAAAVAPPGGLAQPPAVPPGGLVQPTQAMPTTPQDINIPNTGGPDLPGATQAQATIRPQNLAQPQAVPLSEGQGSNVAAGGPTSLVMPTQEVTAKPPVNTPEGLRAEAQRVEALGTKAGSERANQLRQRADSLETRILEEQKQAGELVEVADQTSSSGTRYVKKSEAAGKEGSKKFSSAQVNVNAFTPASEAAQKDFIDKTSKNYDTLRNATTDLQNLEAAKALIPRAAPFVGSFGEKKKDIVKFFNNTLGTNIAADSVASAEELQSRLFQQIMGNLKKLDSQPSEAQQFIMQKSLGTLNTDPAALPRILDVMDQIIRSRVNTHNQEVKSGIDHGVKFPYNPVIDLPPPKGVSTKTISWDDLK